MYGMSTDQKSDQNHGESASIRAAELSRLRRQSEEGRSGGDGASSSHAKLTVVVSVAMVAVILALFSAFAWPGWALNKTGQQAAVPAHSTTTIQPTTPSIKAKELPAGSTRLLKAMPDNVLDFARTQAGPSKIWLVAAPLEEYTLVYSTGKAGGSVTLNVAQWSDSDEATGEYDLLAKDLKGSSLSAGDVKVSGKVTGEYVVKARTPGAKSGTTDGAACKATDSGEASGKTAGRSSKSSGSSTGAAAKATALWHNDTVLFQATGSQAAVQRFYERFPL